MLRNADVPEDSATPAALLRRLSDLQHANIVLTDKLAEQQHRVRQLAAGAPQAAPSASLEDAIRQKDALERQIGLLEGQLLKGDYNPATTMILHLKANPASRAQEARGREVASLREENARLLTALKTAGDGGQGADAAAAVELKRAREELKKKDADSEQRVSRILQRFNEKQVEFRELCNHLTGYTIDILSGDRVRLTSMYAENEGDHLLFQRGKDPWLQLIETDFSNSLLNAIAPYMTKRASIPAMLSAITVELFNRQTTM